MNYPVRNNKQRAPRVDVVWAQVKTFDRVVERSNGFRQTLRVLVSKSSRRRPEYSLSAGVLSQDGQQLYRNVGIGYEVDADGKVRLDSAVDEMVDLISDAADWIEEQLQVEAVER